MAFNPSDYVADMRGQINDLGDDVAEAELARFLSVAAAGVSDDLQIDLADDRFAILPAPLAQAILLVATYLFDNRGADAAGVMGTGSIYHDLTKRYRVFSK